MPYIIHLESFQSLQSPTNFGDEAFFNTLHRQVMQDISISYALHEYTFNPNTTILDLKEKWKDLCRKKRKFHNRERTHLYCSSDLESELQKGITNALEEIIKRGVKRFHSPNEIVLDLNSKIEQLNNLKSEITPLHKTNGFGYDTDNESWPVERQEALATMSPKEAAKEIVREKFEKFQKRYFTVASEGAGNLLLSEVIQNQVGRYESLKDGLKVLNEKKCKFGPTSQIRKYQGELIGTLSSQCAITYGHKNSKRNSSIISGERYSSTYQALKKISSPAHVTQAISEIRVHMLSLAHSIGDIKKKRDQRRQNEIIGVKRRRGVGLKLDIVKLSADQEADDMDIVRLVRSNPVAVGQVLITNPQFAKNVCDTFQDLQEKTEEDEKWAKIYDYGGAVAGVTILAAGFLIPPLGISIATTAWTVGVAGVALTAVELPYRVTQYSKTRQHREDMIGALFAETLQRNYDSLQEVRQAVENFKEQQLAFALLAGFSIFDVAEVRALVRSARRLRGLKQVPFNEISDHEKTEQLNYLTNFLSSISKNFSNQGQKVFLNDNILKWGVNRLGRDKVGNFLSVLANSLRYQNFGHQKLADKLFQRMGQMNQDELIEFIESTLDIARSHRTRSLEGHYRAQIKHIREVIENPNIFRELAVASDSKRERRIKNIEPELMKRGLQRFSILSNKLGLNNEQSIFLLSMSSTRATEILSALEEGKYSHGQIQEFFSELKLRSLKLESKFNRGGEIHAEALCRPRGSS